MKLGKKRRLPLIGALSFGLLLSTVGVLVSSKESKLDEVQGYSTSSLPTTIDLNDTSAANIRSYYSSLNSLSDSERKGTNLLKNLKTILKNGQKYYGYDGKTDKNNIWKMYEIIDRDWDKSPASAISGYNATTKKITGYSYNSTNPYLHALYINRDVDNQTQAWGNHNQNQWGINQEHVWPKSQGFENSGAGGARGDPMHLMAGNGYSNNIHSNYFYGYVNTSSSYTDCGNQYSNQSGNLRGTSKTLKTGMVFEPQDCDKGDIARAIFYMAARYNYLSDSDSDGINGINSNNPNLEILQSSAYASSGYSSTTTTTGKMGILTDLLNWHHQDPVDEHEIHRNNLLYTNYTNNRNPFIDFPEWVDFIWGTATYNGTIYKSYSSTPTGHATPSSDTINGYNGGSSDPVAVTGVSLEKEETSINVGSSEVLSYTISPNNATNRGVSWTSSNTGVATVSSSGRVEGVAEGSATITITTSDGNFTDTCSVNVVASGSGGGTSGEGSIVFGSATGNLNINSSTVSGDDSLGNTWTVTTAGTASFTPNSGYAQIGSSNAPAKSITFTTTLSDSMAITDFSASFGGFSGTAGTVTLNVGNTTVGTGSLSATTDVTVSATDKTQEGSVLTVTVTGISKGVKAYNISYTCESDEPAKTLDSISLDTSDAQTEFTTGDTFSYEGLSVTANYSDGSSDIITPTSVSSPNMSTAGEKTVTVTYTEDGVTRTATYTITVNAPTKTLSSITLDTTNVTKTFNVGDTFNYDNLKVIAHYSDESSDYVTPTSVSSPDMSTSGSKTVTVSYSEKSASYSITVSNEGSTTASVKVADYATVHSWVNSQKYDEIAVDSNITAKVGVKSANTGKYYTSGNEWRYYQTENATIIIECKTQYIIDTVTITYGVSNTGTLKDVSSKTVESGVSQSVNASSVTYSVGNTSTATNGQVKITAITVEYHLSEIVPTSITATVDRSYYVGEILTKSDITVVDNNDKDVTDFVFADYMFTYSDAASGGALTNKNFTIIYNTYSLSTTLLVQVQRKSYAAPTGSVTDTLLYSTLGFETHSSYQTWSGISPTGGSSAVYAGNSCGNANNYIQLRKSSDIQAKSGIVSTTSGGTLSSVTVSWNSSTTNGRFITIFGSNTAYTSADDLYSDSKKGTELGRIVKGTSTSLTITGSYQFIGILANGALYLDDINISYSSSETPTNVANYIMYTDTNNQCETKYGVAKGYFNNLSAANRAVFMRSEDYVIATARERFLDWAKHHGETITYSNSDYVVGSNPSPINIVTTSTSTTLIIVVISLVAAGAIGGYFYLRRREQK